MDRTTVLKIKDSVDLFLSNDKYLMVYYMNSRQRKSFRVNEAMIRMLETIDGVKTVENICEVMKSSWDIEPSYVKDVLNMLQQNRIITEIITNQTLLSSSAMERYKRQINYFTEFLGSEYEGIVAQRKLLDTHIIVFGCGAVGGDIAVQLAMAGIGHITLFDHDKVEKSDLSRHMYYRGAYDSLDKVEALRTELMKINPDIQADCILDTMQPESNIVNLIRSADFIVNTLDEPYIGYTAAKISRICVKYRIPHYIAGGFDAHLASTGELIIPHVTPCVECYATHFKKVLKDWKPKKHPIMKRYAEIGGLSSMSLFSSSYACIEIIKCIVGLVKMEDSFKIRGEFLFHDMSLTYLNVKKNPACPICGGSPNVEA